jgi:hypothetical protein
MPLVTASTVFNLSLDYVFPLNLMHHHRRSKGAGARNEEQGMRRGSVGSVGERGAKSK